MRSRRRLWLAAAVLLLGAAALLPGLAEERKPAPAREVEFPRWMRAPERERALARRSLPPAAVAPAPQDAAPPPPRRDPFLVALPANPRAGIAVFEANALRHSRIGELFVDCVQRTSRRDPFEEMRREAGIDPLKDVDRVAVADEGVVASGFFDRARLDRLERDSTVTRYGDEGRIYTERGGADAPLAIGAWRDQLIVLGDASFVREALDRVEGRVLPQGEPAIPEALTYGEAYGVVPGTALQTLFTGGQEDLGRRLADVAQRIELHADAMSDIALVARVSGSDLPRLDDLATAFGAALSLGRLDARARGHAELGELLEHARVARNRDGFALELALPIEVVERWFEGCRPPGGAEPRAAPQ